MTSGAINGAARISKTTGCSGPTHVLTGPTAGQKGKAMEDAKKINEAENAGTVGSELSAGLGATGNVQRLFEELEVAMSHTQRWSYWGPLIDAAKREHRRNEAAFDGQSRELETACTLLEELGPEHIHEYRCRAYPKLYKRV